MILDKSYRTVFKGTNVSGSERKFVVGTAFLRDSRTGLHGMLTFRHDVMQIWAILDYENSFQMSLNKTTEPFDGPLRDVSVGGWGDELTILVTTIFSSVFRLAHDVDTEEIGIKKIGIPNALFSRFLPGREIILCATSDGKLCHYSFNGEPILMMDTAENVVPTCVSLVSKGISSTVVQNSNGRLIAFGDHKGNVHVHDADSLALISSLECCFSDVTDISFVAENTQLLVAEDRGSVQLYSLEELGPETTWSKLRQFCGHEGSVNKIAVCSASNGERFATASDDSTVCIWDLSREDVLHRFKYENEAVCSLSFSPDGLYLGVSTDDGNTYVHSVPDVSEFNDDQCFVPFEDFSNNFWLLQGFTVFDAQALRKQLGIYNDEEEALIFIKHKLDPKVKLREIFLEFANEMALKQQEEEEELRTIREERERQQRLLDRKMQMDKLREAAKQDGVDFVEPELDPIDEQYLQELQNMDDEFSQTDQTLAEIVAQAGVDISDSDSDVRNNYDGDSDIPKSPITQTGNPLEPDETNNDATLLKAFDKSEEEIPVQIANQLWATDDEDEADASLVQEPTKTEEELRKIFDECIDTTAEMTQTLDALEKPPEFGPGLTLSSPPINDSNEPRSPLSD